MSTDQQAPAPPKKKRIRKPKPTPYKQVIKLASSWTIEDKIDLVKEINPQLEAERELLTAKLKSLGAIGVE